MGKARPYQSNSDGHYSLSSIFNPTIFNKNNLLIFVVAIISLGLVAILSPESDSVASEKLGFSNVEVYRNAKSKGFQNYEEWLASSVNGCDSKTACDELLAKAKKAGFSTILEYKAEQDKIEKLAKAKQAGFDDVKAYDVATSKGFNNKSDYDKAIKLGLSNDEELQAYNKVVSGNPNAIVGDSGETKLHIAAKNGEVTLVKALIKAGANVNAQDKYKWLPLHYGVDNGNFDIVKLLLANGAKVNHQDENGTTALAQAIRGEANKRIVEILIANGANIHLTDISGDTPLHDASYFGKTDIVEVLLEKVLRLTHVI
jgi:hypothetical protein